MIAALTGMVDDLSAYPGLGHFIEQAAKMLESEWHWQM